MAEQEAAPADGTDDGFTGHFARRVGGGGPFRGRQSVDRARGALVGVQLRLSPHFGLFAGPS